MRIRSVINKALIVLAVVCLSGCFGAKPQVALDKTYKNKIQTTKLIVTKKQDGLELVTKQRVMLPAGAIFGPLGTMVQSAVQLAFLAEAKNLETKAFAPVKNDLLNVDLEAQLQSLLNHELQKNVHFNFTVAELQNAKNVKEMVQIFNAQSYRFVAFVEPKYTIERKISTIIMEASLSIYDKEGVWKNKNEMPKPIYKTTIYHTYQLKDSSTFSHDKNVARWKENDSKLLKIEMGNGAKQLAQNMIKSTSDPFVVNK